MSDKLAGKVALVTGASKGIGAAIAKELAAAGAAVVVNYSSSKEGADRVVAEIAKGGGKAIAVQGDVSKLVDIERLLAETKKAFGGLDILINNAGFYEFMALEEVTEEHYRKIFELNVFGLLFTTKEALKYFGRDGGGVVNISSMASHGTPARGSAYSASKAAVDAMTRSLAKELGPRNIRVNAINPGMVMTEGLQTSGLAESDFGKAVKLQTPLGRLGEPQDIAPAAVFLASSDASFISGEILLIAGGR